MTKWEYRVLSYDKHQPPNLKEEGRQGWELVTMFLDDAFYTCVFKRPLPDYTSTE